MVYNFSMNYTLDNIPYSCENPIVYMDISLKGKVMGRILIQLDRQVFPAGVENFVKIAAGTTYKTTTLKSCDLIKQVQRSYDNTDLFKYSHNNYIVGGDIYNNNGQSAGTIFNDKPIPRYLHDYYYEHNTKGLISLVPFYDEITGKLMYDSTFMITLDSAKPTNILPQLDADQIIIGHIYSGLEVLDEINTLIKPYAGRTYPKFIISKAGVLSQNKIIRNSPIKSSTIDDTV